MHYPRSLDRLINESILRMAAPTEKKPRVRRTRAEIQASQIDELVKALRAVPPDDIATLARKLIEVAPRAAAALWDALGDREKDLGKEPPAGFALHALGCPHAVCMHTDEQIAAINAGNLPADVAGELEATLYSGPNRGLGAGALA